MDGTEERAVRRLRDGEWNLESDTLAVEEVLVIDILHRDVKRRWLSLLRTPGSDEDLVRGLVHTERVVDDVCKVDIQISGDEALVIIDDSVNPRVQERASIDTGVSCGLCGRRDLSDLLAIPHSCTIEEFHVDPLILMDLPVSMTDAQVLFEETGGIHAAAMFDEDGELQAIAEDIGRHNAVDKLIGSVLKHGLDCRRNILCLSGRVGMELVLKAATMEIPIIVSVGAASTMAVDIARQAGISILGFTRSNSCVFYHHS